MSLAEAVTPRAVEPAAPAESPPSRPSSARAIGAALLLLAIYGLCSLTFDPRAFLGTDTGGKVATLRAMDELGTARPDVGYWAADADPAAELHPLYYTVAHDTDPPVFVNVTTLPMLLLAQPLYAVGGYRLALALPMLGGLLCAAAAYALARRLGSSRPWLAFWVVGLASPVAIYALDLWEHTLGLGLMAWGVVHLQSLAPRQEPAVRARALLAAGACFGLAATMRTESLVYAAVAIAVFASWRTVGTVVRDGGWFAAPVLGVLVANQALERALIGGGVRAGRAADTASRLGSDLLVRIEEGLRTTVGMNYADLASDVFVGALLCALVAGAVVFARRGADRHAIECIVGAFVLYGARFVSGFNFISGALAAMPLAVVALAAVPWLRRTEQRAPMRVVLVALLALPAVWLVQFTGGAGPQWGGRYVLLSGFLLAVVGLVVLDSLAAYVRYGVVGLCVLVTAYGLAFAAQRTHEAASQLARVADTSDEFVVSRMAHLFREGGTWYSPQRKWLTAVDDDQYLAAMRVARLDVDLDAPRRTVAVYAYPQQKLAADGWIEVSRDSFEFLSEELVVVRMEPAP